jgi:hypothetical protein
VRERERERERESGKALMPRARSWAEDSPDIIQGGTSYSELAHAAMRDRAISHDGSAKGMLADRQAYMAYLEQQLERVTASCKTVQSYNERLDVIQDAVAESESKIAANTKLCSIAQTFAERVEVSGKKKMTNE